MLEITGNIWEIAIPGDLVVIPTNIGWKANGDGIMGAGLARQAALRWPVLEPIWGRHCMQHGSCTPILILASRGIILLPTKPLNSQAPQLSWRERSDLVLIERGLQALRVYHLPNIPNAEGNQPNRILLPLLGCGLGGLSPAHVIPLMRKILGAHPRFVLVKQTCGSRRKLNIKLAER